MTVDERLRAELTRALEDGLLREDEAYDSVRSRHGRDLVRRRMTRHAVAAAVVLLMFASAAVVVAWRGAPDHPRVAASGSSRFRSTATIRIAPGKTSSPKSGPKSTTTTRPLPLADPRKLALAPGTQRAALRAAHRSPDNSNVNFRAALNRRKDIVSLSTTASSRTESQAVTREWAYAFAKARRAEAVRLLQARTRVLRGQVRALHQQLKRIDAELMVLAPGIYHHPLLITGVPNGSPSTTPVHSPELGSTHALNLANKRVQLLASLADVGAEAARAQLMQVRPDVYASLIGQTPPVRVDTPRRSNAPTVVGWAIGLTAVLAGAIFVYRRRTRQVAA